MLRKFPIIGVLGCGSRAAFFLAASVEEAARRLAGTLRQSTFPFGEATT